MRDLLASNLPAHLRTATSSASSHFFLNTRNIPGNISSTFMLTIPGPDDFEARSPDELSLRKGDQIELIERDDDFGDGWYLGKQILDGKMGLFPQGEISVITNGVRG